MSILSDLKRIALFALLSDTDLRRLAAVVYTARYDDGQVIMLEGDHPSPVFFVLEGAVRAFRTNPDGREQNLIRLAPGDAFNMPAAFQKKHAAHASAAAIGPTRLLLIDAPAFAHLTSQTPAIARAVLEDFASKLDHLTTLTHNLSLRSVRGRLAQFLLKHAQTESPSPLHWTQDEIAAQVGTVREVVSRTLRAFVREGLIQMKRQQITILDPQALRRETDA